MRTRQIEEWIFNVECEARERIREPKLSLYYVNLVIQCHELSIRLDVFSTIHKHLFVFVFVMQFVCSTRIIFCADTNVKYQNSR